MEGVNWVAVGVLATVTIAVGGGLLRKINQLSKEITEQRVEMTRQIAEAKAEAAREIAAYKLEAAQRFASTGYLKDVEERLLKMLEEIKFAIRELNNVVHRAPHG